MADHLQHTHEYWRQLRDGNADALSALYQLHYVGLINYGVKFTGNRDMANDCLTSVLLELWEKRASLPDVTNVRAYLITCLHHRILQEIKNDKKRDDSHKAVAITASPSELSYEDYLTRTEDKDLFNKRFAAAFHKLTQRQQQLLRMKFFEDHDYDSIAAACGITKRTAYNIIHDALKQLKNELKEFALARNILVTEPFILTALFLFFQQL